MYGVKDRLCDKVSQAFQRAMRNLREQLPYVVETLVMPSSNKYCALNKMLMLYLIVRSQQYV